MTMTNEPELTPAQQRLEDMRAEVAKLEASQSLPEHPYDDARPRTAQPGEWMHCLDEGGIPIPRSASIFGAPSVTLYRGDEIEIDAAMLEADLDRHGRPGWAALLHDDAMQVEKWGSVRLRPGRAPRDLQPWVHGSPLWSEQREAARRAAWAEPNPERRAEALAEVKRTYGDAPTTSTVLNTATTPTERAAAEQAERIAASAAAGVPNLGPSRGGE